VLLPDSMLAAEIGRSWRPLETAGMLSAWTITGMVLAPWLLRRTTLRESGSRLSARRHSSTAARPVADPCRAAADRRRLAAAPADDEAGGDPGEEHEPDQQVG
jgi:hypothetical protein